MGRLIDVSVPSLANNGEGEVTKTMGSILDKKYRFSANQNK